MKWWIHQYRPDFVPNTTSFLHVGRYIYFFVVGRPCIMTTTTTMVVVVIRNILWMILLKQEDHTVQSQVLQMHGWQQVLRRQCLWLRMLMGMITQRHIGKGPCQIFIFIFISRRRRRSTIRITISTVRRIWLRFPETKINRVQGENVQCRTFDLNRYGPRCGIHHRRRCGGGGIRHW